LNIINRFEFDFRYYNPFSGNELRKPGVYVFKTTDLDSFPLGNPFPDDYHMLSKIVVH
jgi:hypothetical protein